MYALARKALFRLDPEKAHHLTLRLLPLMKDSGLLRLAQGAPLEKPRRVMGLDFPNPVGLAAGLDKDGEYIDAFGALGFGFIEVGTVTPLPQPGNPQPRLFRIPEKQAIINRMGFNNQGVDALVERAACRKWKGVLGINIGKNKVTPNEKAIDDYRIGLETVYPVADYVAVNISSPNTAGLRELQGKEYLSALLGSLKEQQKQLEDKHQRHVPVAVKIAPDLDEQELDDIAACIASTAMDAVIATNTTIARDAVSGCRHADEQGGLSGAPVNEKSTAVIAGLRKRLPDTTPIIGVGGILCAQDAKDKIDAGAELVQLYSGLIYQGPGLVREVAEAL